VEKIATMSPKRHKPTKVGNYKTFRTCNKNVMVVDQSKVFFLERNGKIHCKEKHHIKKNKRMEGKQTQINQSLKVYQEILPFKGG
jgi:hypothetical protein